MKFEQQLRLLVPIVVVLSTVAAFAGIFSSEGDGAYTVTTFRGDVVTLYGKGIYADDSAASAMQVIGQDIVTLIVGVPLLVTSFLLARQGSLKGRLMLAGTLGYFLYTYASYTFLVTYNDYFLVYVAIMSASFFAFTLTMMSFDKTCLATAFKANFPTKRVGGFLLFLGVAVSFMWLSRLVQAKLSHTTPIGLEHYTTLIIQALDLGFVVPVAIVAGFLVLKRESFGYLLASIVIFKGLTLSLAVLAMEVMLVKAGVEVSRLETGLFAMISIGILYVMGLVLRHVVPRGGRA